MSGFNDVPGQGPDLSGRNPEHLNGFEAAPAPAAVDPGRTLGIVGFVLSIFFAVIGLIVSIVALNQSKKAGYTNGFAVAGVIIGIVTSIGAIVAAFFIIFSVFALGAAVD